MDPPKSETKPDKISEILDTISKEGTLPESKLMELFENRFQKPYTQSEIFEIQKAVLAALAKNTEQGKRTDLQPDTTPVDIDNTDVTHHNKPTRTHSQTGLIFDESREQVRKRQEVFKEAEKSPEKYAPLIKRLDAGKTSINTAYNMISQKERSLPPAPIPAGQCDVFLADIPEKWDMGSTVRGSADNHYATMTPAELVTGLFDKQDIRQMFAKNAIIFFWISTSFQYYKIPIEHHLDISERVSPDGDYMMSPDSITIQTPTYQAILDSWGFDKIVDEFVWVKDKMGLGRRSRSKHEKVLVATKGDFPRPAELFESVISAPRGQHSRKPPLHEIIEKMYPKGHKYRELFARADTPRKNWTYWGNESG